MNAGCGSETIKRPAHLISGFDSLMVSALSCSGRHCIIIMIYLSFSLVLVPARLSSDRHSPKNEYLHSAAVPTEYLTFQTSSILSPLEVRSQCAVAGV